MVTKKIVIKAENTKGKESTIFEIRQPKIKTKRINLKRNPNKRMLFDIYNRDNEHVRVVHYRGNDYLNVFCDLGAHDARMMLTKVQIRQMISVLKEFLSS